MNTPPDATITARLTAFAAAAVVTLALAAGIDRLAVHHSGEAQMAKAAPTQAT